MAEKLRKAWEEAEFLKQMNASLVANQASALYIYSLQSSARTRIRPRTSQKDSDETHIP